MTTREFQFDGDAPMMTLIATATLCVVAVVLGFATAGRHAIPQAREALEWERKARRFDANCEKVATLAAEISRAESFAAIYQKWTTLRFLDADGCHPDFEPETRLDECLASVPATLLCYHRVADELRESIETHRKRSVETHRERAANLDVKCRYMADGLLARAEELRRESLNMPPDIGEFIASMVHRDATRLVTEMEPSTCLAAPDYSRLRRLQCLAERDYLCVAALVADVGRTIEDEYGPL